MEYQQGPLGMAPMGSAAKHCAHLSWGLAGHQHLQTCQLQSWWILWPLCQPCSGDHQNSSRGAWGLMTSLRACSMPRAEMALGFKEVFGF